MLPPARATGISAFLDLGCDDQVIARAVEASFVDRLKKLEQQFGAETFAKPVRFFQHGSTGQWREGFIAELYRRYVLEMQ
jgi:hypothetical protein